jgi:tetraacyldisaccharide 4'-kinase
MQRLAARHRQLVTEGPRGWGERALFALLCGAGWLYGKAMALRRCLYRRGILASYRAPVPVIAVGNLTLGGTGKTPMVDHLLTLLQTLGCRVAVVSRGYGGRGFGRVGVVCAGDGPLLSPRQCGDEPYLLARRNPRALVLVAPRRAEGIRHAVEELAADIILLDDGFQHLAVARDADIVLLDARRPLGNGRLFPAGILREPATSLAEASALILTRSRGDEEPPQEPGCPVIRCRHRLAPAAVALDGGTVPLAELRRGRGVAFAGIADPESFFSALADAGLELQGTIPLPDHETYGEATLAMLTQASRGADFMVTTEKDGVKLLQLTWPVPCYLIPMSLEFYHHGASQLHRLVVDIARKEHA